jgi:hypothetical protein
MIVSNACTINIVTIINDDPKWCVYYKHVIALPRVINYASRAVNYVPRVMLQIVVSITEDSRGIIYDHNMFIVEAKVGNDKKHFNQV